MVIIIFNIHLSDLTKIYNVNVNIQHNIISLLNILNFFQIKSFLFWLQINIVNNIINQGTTLPSFDHSRLIRINWKNIVFIIIWTFKLLSLRFNIWCDIFFQNKNHTTFNCTILWIIFCKLTFTSVSILNFIIFRYVKVGIYITIFSLKIVFIRPNVFAKQA